MSANELNQNVSMDDLLDATIDDLADMPEFKPFPAGAHRMKLNFTKTKVNDIDSIQVKLTYIEPVELHNAGDTPPAPGDTTNVLFMFKKKDSDGKLVRNELAEGQFKNLLIALAPSFPEAKKNSEIMAAAEGFEVVGVTSVRKNDKDKQNVKYYTSLDNVIVA